MTFALTRPTTRPTTSCTTTTLVATTQLQTLHLVLSARPENPVKEKLQQFLQKLRATKRIAENTLTQWEREFNQFFQNDQKTESSLALCYLLDTLIRPVFGIDPLDENGVKDLISLTLPQGKNVEQFLKESEQLSDEETVFQMKLACIEQTFLVCMHMLNSATNTMNEQLRADFEAFKSRLVLINRARNNDDQRITQIIQTYAGRINQVLQALTGQVADVKKLG